MIAAFWARFSYLNPGMQLLFEEFASRSPDEIVATDVTKCTPTSVRELAQRASAVIIDQSVYNAATWAEAKRRSVYNIHEQRPHAHYREILDVLLDSSPPKVFALYFDLHDPKNRELVSKLRGRVDAISWMFEKEPKSVAEVPARYRDAWLTDQYDPVNVWQEVVRSFPVRIELPFAVARSELCARQPLHVWDVSVVGAPYLTRSIARKSIRQERLSLAPSRAAALSVEVFTRVVSPLLSARQASQLLISSQQQLQALQIRAAPTSFVCGGPLAFAVRKFFEIPALRSALVASPCVGFEDLGFRDGHNTIVSSPEDAGPAARRLLQNDGLRRSIANEAFGLVSTVHSMRQRVNDFLTCIQRLGAGQLRNAQFFGGKFEIA